MTLGPGWQKYSAYFRAGLVSPPLALRLSEKLGAFEV